MRWRTSRRTAAMWAARTGELLAALLIRPGAPGPTDRDRTIVREPRDTFRVAFGTLLLAALLAGCGGSGTGEAEVPEAPAFDVAAVKANFTDECADPIIVDELFCEQVDIGGMTADGSILIVPTTLSALGGADARAQAICHQLVIAHFDGDGVDLGYDTIGILDRGGGNAAACTVSR